LVSESNEAPPTAERIEQVLIARTGLAPEEWILDTVATIRGRNGNLPIDPVSVLASIGVDIEEFDDPASFGSVSAQVSGRFLLRVAPGLPDSQHHFTVAHEVGHVLLHRLSDGAFVGGDAVEAFCDQFAIHLLCPLSFVEAVVREFGLSLPVIEELASQLCVPERPLWTFLAAQYPATVFWGRPDGLKYVGSFDVRGFQPTIETLAGRIHDASSIVEDVSHKAHGINQWRLEVNHRDGSVRGLLKPYGLGVRDSLQVRVINIPREKALRSEAGEWRPHSPLFARGR